MADTLTAEAIPTRALEIARRALRTAADTGVGTYGEGQDMRDLAESITIAQLPAAVALVGRAATILQHEGPFVGDWPAPELAFHHAHQALQSLGPTVDGIRFGHLDVLTRHLDEAAAQLDRAESLIQVEPAELSNQELVEAAIRVSGLGVAQFAHEVMAGRNERTIRRWRSGEIALPEQTRDWLESWLAARVQGTNPPARRG